MDPYGSYPYSPEATGRMQAHVELLAQQLKRLMLSASRLLPAQAPFDMHEHEYLVWRDCEEAELLLKRCGKYEQIPTSAPEPDWMALQSADDALQQGRRCEQLHGTQGETDSCGKPADTFDENSGEFLCVECAQWRKWNS